MLLKNMANSSGRKPKKLRFSGNLNSGSDQPFASKSLYYTSTSANLDMSDAQVGSPCLVWTFWCWSTTSISISDAEFNAGRTTVHSFTDSANGSLFHGTVTANMVANGLTVTDANASARKVVGVFYFTKDNNARGLMYDNTYVLTDSLANASKNMRNPAGTYGESYEGDILLLLQMNGSAGFYAENPIYATDNWQEVSGSNSYVKVRYKYLGNPAHSADLPLSVPAQNYYTNSLSTSYMTYAAMVVIKNPNGATA